MQQPEGYKMDHIPTFGSRLRWKKLIGYFRDVSPKARDFDVTGILSIM